MGNVEYDRGMEWLLVFVIVFFAIFVQSLTGFGLALVSMPFLAALLGVQTAAPLVALFGLVAEVILLLYFREARMGPGFSAGSWAGPILRPGRR
jgi:uncharacterized membrane protein YfcA